MARPTIFNQALAEEIAERLASGETLNDICQDDGMPNPSTVWRWEVKDAEFCKLLTRAREFGAHLIAGSTRVIADDGRNDWMEKHGRDGEAVGWQVNGEAVARSKLRVEQRWREAQALAPRSYGLKYQHIEHSGSIGVNATTDEEILGRITELLASGRVHLPAGVELVEDAEEDDFSDIA